LRSRFEVKHLVGLQERQKLCRNCNSLADILVSIHARVCHVLLQHMGHGWSKPRQRNLRIPQPILRRHQNKMTFQTIILAPAPIVLTQRGANIEIAIIVPPGVLCMAVPIFVRSLSVKLWQVITDNMSQRPCNMSQELSTHHWEGHKKLDREVNMITHTLDTSGADPSYCSPLLCVYQYVEVVAGICGKEGRIQVRSARAF
jgi:hypothetical protein